MFGRTESPSGDDDDGPEPTHVVGNHDDEDEEDEKEVEELTKLEPDDDRSLSTHSLFNLCPSNSDPSPVSTPSPAPIPASIPGHANVTAPPKRVQYVHGIDYPTGEFEYRMGLNHGEPIPKFRYLVDQKDALRTYVKVIPMKRKREENDGKDDNEDGDEQKAD